MSVESIYNEYKEEIGKETLFCFHGKYSPLIVALPWTNSSNDKELYLLGAAKEREAYVAVSQDRYFNFARGMFVKFMEEEKSISDLKKVYKMHAKKIEEFYYKHSLKTNLKELGVEELQKITKESAFLLSELIADTIYSETLDKEIIFDVIKDISLKEELESLWDELSHPFFLSFESRRAEFILGLLKKRSFEETFKMIRYMYTDYYSNKEDAEIKKELKKFEKDYEKIKGNIEKQKDEIRRRKKELEIVLKSKSKELGNISKYIDFIMQLRDLRKDPIAETQTILLDVAYEIFERFDLPKSKALLFLPSEIYNHQLDKNYLTNLIKKRENGALFLVRPDSSMDIEYIPYEEAKNMIESLIDSKLNKEFKEIRGSSASKGLVRGKVRIVLDAANSKLKDGEILVTGMTRPEFVTLMKKAAAIITNEGGITSHAAIVSRELKKPCIIGTKIATKVLKDGDLVEVDANNGIVKIINKA